MGGNKAVTAEQNKASDNALPPWGYSDERLERAEAEVEQLRAAIREHRDAHLAGPMPASWDHQLWSVLSDG